MLAEKYYRPVIHFAPPFGWLNDPNGLVYKDGEFHLFYQYHPQSSVWGPMHWGHAVSQDLLCWTHQPIALSPDEQGMCFSGTATVDTDDKSGLFNGESGLLAYYTIAAEPPAPGADPSQAQGLAYSSDNGRSWTKYPGNPVLDEPEISDFRDPKVFWYQPGKYWVMVVTLGQKVGIYRSDDAKNWQRMSEFGEGHGAHDERAWECPDLFEINVEGSEESRWILIVGVQREAYTPGSGTQYFIGHFDGERFVNDNSQDTVLWLDYGRDFYATQTWADLPASDGRRLAISWMSCWPYANQVPTHSWRSAMSAPRELFLKETPDGLRLHHAFVRELKLAQRNSKRLASLPVRFAPQLVLNSRWQGACRLSLALELEDGASVRLTPFTDAWFELTCKDGRLTVISARDGTIGVPEFDEHYPHQFDIALGGNRLLTLDLLLDRSSTELLIDNGRYAITNLVFPATGPQHPLQVELTSGNATVHDCQWHQLALPNQ